ncbi:MAG: hypothetical protein KY450_02610 [Actinobacteria bacterium]|nr:hypothetical protein [Actinomycetota bacterium]
MTDARPRPWRLGLAVLALTGLALTGACSDEGDDLRPSEPEVGEEDTEVVPGEGGPVD